MRFLCPHRHAMLASCASVLLAATAATAAADPPAAPDTSSWKCTQCPFYQGYEAQVQGGILYADGANASYGRYTGVDRSTAYADAAASGQYRRADGLYADYDLESLGLPSREGYIEAGQGGHYNLRLSYNGQPTRLYDAAVTPYQGLGEGAFGLPSNWGAAGTTGAMTQLRSSLAPIPLGYDRTTLSALGQFFTRGGWKLFGEFRRQEKDGTDFTSASFLTQAVQLPEPIHYVTNSFEGGAAWTGRWAGLRVSYTGSWFQDNSSSLTFANPYLPIIPGATLGRLASPPGNSLHQLALSGDLQLPWFASTLTYNVSLGRLFQNAPFVPVSTLPGSLVPLPGSLDGDVHVSHFALALAGRPLSKLSVRGSAAYDGRDDQTTPIAVTYIVTDTFPGGTDVTPRYGEDRLRLDGGADYVLFRWLRVGVGGEIKDVRYSPGQVLTHTQEMQSWGRASFTPWASLDFTLKGGDGTRKASPFNAGALPAEENPLLRDFNYAPRDQVFYTATGTWSATSVVTVAVEGFFADDAYRLSQLGLQTSKERRVSSTVTWKVRDTLSVYADGGYERLSLLQDGYTGAFTAPWTAADTERFWSAGVGAQWEIRQHWSLKADYLHAPSYDDTDSMVGALAQPFPQNWTRFESLRFDLTYHSSTALQFHFRYSFEQYNSNDWGLDGVEPSTIPDLITLGLQPYRHNVSLFGVTASYQFGHTGAGT